jgi:hypothetical protein
MNKIIKFQRLETLEEVQTKMETDPEVNYMLQEIVLNGQKYLAPAVEESLEKFLEVFLSESGTKKNVIQRINKYIHRR